MRKLPEKQSAFLCNDPILHCATLGQFPQQSPKYGDSKQHIFKKSTQGMRSTDSNLKLPLKRALGLHASLCKGAICPSLELSLPHGLGHSQGHVAQWLTLGFIPALQGSLHGIWIMPSCSPMCDQETGPFAPGVLAAGPEGHLGT